MNHFLVFFVDTHQPTLFIVSIVIAHLQKTNSVWLDRVIGYYLKVHLASTVVLVFVWRDSSACRDLKNFFSTYIWFVQYSQFQSSFSFKGAFEWVILLNKLLLNCHSSKFSHISFSCDFWPTHSNDPLRQFKYRETYRFALRKFNPCSNPSTLSILILAILANWHFYYLLCL